MFKPASSCFSQLLLDCTTLKKRPRLDCTKMKKRPSGRKNDELLIVMLMLVMLMLAMLMLVITVHDDPLLLHGPKSWRALNTQIGLSTSLIACVLHF